MRSNRILISSIVLVLLAGVASAQVHVFRGGGGFLGVDLRDVEPEDVSSQGLSKETGVVIERVVDDSAAADAGLESGDVILRYAGIPVISVRQFQRLVSETPPGRDIEIQVSRGGRTLELNAQIGRREGLIPGDVRLPRFNFSWRDHLPEFDQESDDEDGSSRVFIFSSRPRLGITGTPMTQQMAEFMKVPQGRGILVMEVRKDSAAQRAGIKAGDVIVGLDGDEVEDLHGLSRGLDSGDHEVEIYRNGRSQRLKVEIEKKSRKRSPGRRRL